MELFITSIITCHVFSRTQSLQVSRDILSKTPRWFPETQPPRFIPGSVRLRKAAMAKRNAPGEPPEKQHVPEAISKGKWFSNHHFSGGLCHFRGTMYLVPKKIEGKKIFGCFSHHVFRLKLDPYQKYLWSAKKVNCFYVAVYRDTKMISPTPILPRQNA